MVNYFMKTRNGVRCVLICILNSKYCTQNFQITFHLMTCYRTNELLGLYYHIAAKHMQEGAVISDCF
jgi:hypothetical protein